MDTLIVIACVFVILSCLNNFAINYKMTTCWRGIEDLQKLVRNRAALFFVDEPEVKIQKEALLLSNKYIREYKMRMSGDGE